MARWLDKLKSPWVVTLLISIGLFVFWNGPVFTAPSLNHGGRLIVSYTFIPLAVAAVLIYKRTWSWGSFGYFTLGLAMIKMVLTMGVHLWVIPRGARTESKPIAQASSRPAPGPQYQEQELLSTSSLSGRVMGDAQAGRICMVSLLDIVKGRPLPHHTHAIDIKNASMTPPILTMSVGDSLVLSNHDQDFHTFVVRDASQQILQIPLPPNQKSANHTLNNTGHFVTQCAFGHPDESMSIFVWGHPYHALTSIGSDFAFDSVPSGHVQLGLWWRGHAAEFDVDSPDSVVEYELAPGEAKTVTIEISVMRLSSEAQHEWNSPSRYLVLCGDNDSCHWHGRVYRSCDARQIGFAA